MKNIIKVLIKSYPKISSGQRSEEKVTWLSQFSSLINLLIIGTKQGGKC